MAGAWEAVFKMRAIYLERGIKELLRNSDLVARVYQQIPSSTALYQGNYGEKKVTLPLIHPDALVRPCDHGHTFAVVEGSDASGHAFGHDPSGTGRSPEG